MNGELENKQNLFTNEVTSYKHDIFGNLLSVTIPNGDVISYLPDGFNRRTARFVNGVFDRGWIYFDPLHPMAEINSSGQIESVFIYATKSNVPDAMIKGGVKYRIVTDHLGSLRLVINASSGAIAQAMQYDDWGNVILDTNPGFQPFGFAGGIYDPITKLERFGARDYDPNTGRFLTKDPIGFASGDANMYRYVLNDPINRVDPTGLFNILVGSGGNATVFAGGGEATSGGYYNVETGSSGGFTSSGGGSNQYGLGAMGGAFIGVVTGPTSNVAGAFENWNLAIPGTNISATVYLNGSGDFVGGAIGYGPGIGFTRTNTNTTLYGQCH